VIFKKCPVSDDLDHMSNSFYVRYAVQSIKVYPTPFIDSNAAQPMQS